MSVIFEYRVFINAKKIASFFIHSISIICLFYTLKICLFGFGDFLPSEQQQVTLSLVLGISTSYIFYLYTIHLPERVRENIIKNKFNSDIHNFRFSVVLILLGALNETPQTDLVESLIVEKNFKKYFKESPDGKQSRWDLILDELDRNQQFRSNILFELKTLREECQYILGVLPIYDTWVYSFLKNLNKIIYTIEKQLPDENRILGSFLWEMFSGWNFAKGYEVGPIERLNMSL